MNMKAIYQKPVTEIVMLSIGAHLLEGSNKNGILGDNPTTADFDLGQETNTTDATSDNLSRRSVWADEEEEDF